MVNFVNKLRYDFSDLRELMRILRVLRVVRGTASKLTRVFGEIC